MFVRPFILDHFVLPFLKTSPLIVHKTAPLQFGLNSPIDISEAFNSRRAGLQIVENFTASLNESLDSAYFGNVNIVTSPLSSKSKTE